MRLHNQRRPQSILRYSAVQSVLRVNARCGRATKELRESQQLVAESRVLIETSRL
jgi:hypothetical protein